ncbi:FecCD family ABC transporter permease [Corynebacterium halotolerans]|uniref:ABC transporter permease n=1 Tax=Corynebacterium halotolerans YIM 70093 = DSM 44683 TaxID=1121362 RepID=M1MZL9_9CORY|nr:iron chelate uptake ABC transporter family permease subunit [Corynebacterium halotolerans]AGF73159.1 ABC transporter permease [Corynebacterium halotolerans YIM 70093 = DSM 44683]
MTRSRVVTAVLAVAVVCLVIAALGIGEFYVAPQDVIRSLLGRDTGFAAVVVNEWRAPRVAAACLFGAALGISGALFQTLTDNALGSPDVVGFSTGAYTGALIAMTVIGAGAGGTAVGALLGGVATALLVYLFAFNRGVEGYRLIIAGIGTTAALSSVNVWLLLRVDAGEAMNAAMWGAGTLSGITLGSVAIAAAVIVPGLLGTGLIARPLRQLELGDDAAIAHGVRVEPVRLLIIVIAVAPVAAVTAFAGPIAFIALSAPQIARRLQRSEGLPLIGSALTGALLLLLADLVARHLLPGGVPVGTVTVVIGGIYLMWLLVLQTRRSGGRR